MLVVLIWFGFGDPEKEDEVKRNHLVNQKANTHADTTHIDTRISGKASTRLVIFHLSQSRNFWSTYLELHAEVIQPAITGTYTHNTNLQTANISNLQIAKEEVGRGRENRKGGEGNTQTNWLPCQSVSPIKC